MSQRTATMVGAALATWPDRAFRDGLQLIAEGVAEMVGFKLACISVVRSAPGGSQELEVVALAGHDYGNEVVVGRRTPLPGLLKELEKAENWGHFRFLPHEWLDTQDVENAYGWVVPDLVPGEGPDAWHPLDLLVALLYDAQGTLRGSLAIDMPEDGRRPGPEQRRLLEKFAAQAERAVIAHLEREELAEQVRLAETARAIVRNAGAQRGLAEVLTECQTGLVEGFRCTGSWIQTLDEDGRGTGAIYGFGGREMRLPDTLAALAARAARACWTDQTAVVVAANRPAPSMVTAEEQQEIVAFLDSIGVTSMLFVPLGAGDECLGNLVLTRTDSREWTDLDVQAALDIGHDLGRVVLNARTFEREHELVVELQALDTYKSELIATVSHELKNPLTAITGYLELLDGSPDVSGSTRTALDAIHRGADRMARVIDDLLLLSRMEDPHQPLERTDVDLRALVDDVLTLLRVPAQRDDLEIVVEAPDSPVVARGDADELDRVVLNLVSNAVKYTERGRVLIRLARERDRAVLSVVDTGLGISKEDQQRLFTEFFRSSNPKATSRPGTGLGLAIVKRIVQRHGGQITVESELGRGSTFTVRLPAAG